MTLKQYAKKFSGTPWDYDKILNDISDNVTGEITGLIDTYFVTKEEIQKLLEEAGYEFG